jgi:hypothetical protein
MLNAREREVIENHLTGEVATELQGLIRAGEDWVLIVNEELDNGPQAAASSCVSCGKSIRKLPTTRRSHGA